MDGVYVSVNLCTTKKLNNQCFKNDLNQALPEKALFTCLFQEQETILKEMHVRSMDLCYRLLAFGLQLVAPYTTSFPDIIRCDIFKMI